MPFEKPTSPVRFGSRWMSAYWNWRAGGARLNGVDRVAPHLLDDAFAVAAAVHGRIDYTHDAEPEHRDDLSWR